MITPLMIVAGFAAVIWIVFAANILHITRKTRFLRDQGEALPFDPPSVDVIVPAHNEEKWIASTVGFLLAQDYPIRGITVVDDGSTDGTGAILDRLAGTSPIRVIHGEGRPFGWVGKTWAVTQGARGSTADWLLFVDADMGLHPHALSAAMAQARRDGSDLVSYIARPEIETFWQAAVALPIGVILFTMYPLYKANDPSSPVAIAAGGFLMVRRDRYEAAGGHESVRAEIVEDIQLSKRIKEAGGKLSVHFAPDLAWTHMYGTLGDIWRGLRKNAYAGMEYQFHKFFTGAIGGQIMAWSPIVATVVGIVLGSWPLALVGLVGWLAMVAATAPLVPYLRISPLMALAMPVGSFLYTAIACSSVWNHYRGRIIWKDVTFSATEVRQASRQGPGPGDAAPEAQAAARQGAGDRSSDSSRSAP